MAGLFYLKKDLNIIMATPIKIKITMIKVPIEITAFIALSISCLLSDAYISIT